jgi:arylsulfatase A-like enzyme
LLIGQVLSFGAISLYVKLVQMRATPQYAGPWMDSGRWLDNVVDFLRFSTQEAAVFALLLLAAAGWHGLSRGEGSLARALAWLVGLVVLPAFSAIEVLGLAHFAFFLSPLGPEELRMIGWTGHLLSAGNVLRFPEVFGGLCSIAVGYYVAAPLLALARPDRWRGWPGTAVACLVVAGGLRVALPAPVVANARLEPHPLLWLLVGNRAERIGLSETMTAGRALGAGDVQVVPAAFSPHSGPVDDLAGKLPASARRWSVKERPTNVVLFVLESTRAASLVLHDTSAVAGRALLRLRDEMVVFDQIYAPVPTSAHAIFALLYGTYPYLGPFWTSAGKTVVADSLAQFFRRAGYRTHLAITSDLSYDNIRSFAAPGFDTVLDTNDWPGQEQVALLPWGRDDRLLIEEAKRFIAAHDRRPFFLFAMTSNPHHPYAVDHMPGVPPPADADYGRAAYEQLVDYDLRLLAELYDWMKRRGVAGRTLLLVVGDHGEAFGEHAGNFGHAAFIHEENVHVPCFILHPRRLGLPRRIAQLGSQVDLRATILDVLGLHDSAPTDGTSLLRGDPGRLVASFAENGVSRFGVRDARFTFIYTPHAAIEQLFHRQSDPAETRDLAAPEPVITAEYRQRLRHWEAQHLLSLARVLR